MSGTQHDHPGHGGTLSPTELCAPQKAGVPLSAGPETQLSSHGEGHRELWGPLTSTPQKCAALFGTGLWELQGGGGWGRSSWNRFVGADTPPALPHPQLTPCQPFLIFRQTPVRGGCGWLLNGVWGGSPISLSSEEIPLPRPMFWGPPEPGEAQRTPHCGKSSCCAVGSQGRGPACDTLGLEAQRPQVQSSAG